MARHGERQEPARPWPAIAGRRRRWRFLFFRLVSPIGFLAAVDLLRLRGVADGPAASSSSCVICLIGAFFGIKLPEIMITNQIPKRQQSMRRAFPDALDLMLICVESGMSIEQAFRRVSQEIGVAVRADGRGAVAHDRRAVLPAGSQARLREPRRRAPGCTASRASATALVQAERYGTPLGQALRVLAQESREERMHAAEKKAASLPPKLTVPMILFFLPVLLIVILVPAAIQVFKWT